MFAFFYLRLGVQDLCVGIARVVHAVRLQQCNGGLAFPLGHQIGGLFGRRRLRNIRCALVAELAPCRVFAGTLTAY